eukprot:5544898-Pleurochrysis_carterae.AAC.1
MSYVDKAGTDTSSLSSLMPLTSRSVSFCLPTCARTGAAAHDERLGASRLRRSPGASTQLSTNSLLVFSVKMFYRRYAALRKHLHG